MQTHDLIGLSKSAIMRHFEGAVEFLHWLYLSDISRDQAFSSPQYIGLLDKLYKLADYYTEKAQEMRNICLESPRVEINSLNEDSVEQITEDNPR